MLTKRINYTWIAQEVALEVCWSISCNSNIKVFITDTYIDIPACIFLCNTLCKPNYSSFCGTVVSLSSIANQTNNRCYIDYSSLQNKEQNAKDGEAKEEWPGQIISSKKVQLLRQINFNCICQWEKSKLYWLSWNLI